MSKGVCQLFAGVVGDEAAFMRRLRPPDVAARKGPPTPSALPLALHLPSFLFSSTRRSPFTFVCSCQPDRC